MSLDKQPTSAARSQRLEDIIAEFEAVWDRNNPPAVEHYLPPTGPFRTRVLCELVNIDLEFRLKAGQRARVEEYFGRFPELEQDSAAVCDLIVAEYRFRRRRETGLSQEEYLQRFPHFRDFLSKKLETEKAPTEQLHLQPNTAQGDLAQLVSEENHENIGPVPGAPGSLPVVPGYQILDVLGQGGMGIVYRARQVKLDRIVALKMLLPARHTTLDEKVRFQIEAESIARLQHPHVVHIHEIGEYGGRPFFSLEFCAGGSLASRLEQADLKPADAAVLVEKLARATHYAHSCGVIHRDLKPGNVLLTEDGEPKVSDFGLAKRAGDKGRTMTGAILGTPSYLAPEQAGGKKDVGPLADVWALGVILYELLTGKLPFRGATVLDTLVAVQTEEPVPPSRLSSRCPRDLETICLKCLHKEPAGRYESALALADDLGRWSAGVPITARPAGLFERVIKWSRRRPAFAAAAILGVLLLGTLVAGSMAAAVLQANHAADLQQSNEELERRQARIQAAIELAQTNEKRASNNEQQALEFKKQVGRLNVGLLLEAGLERCESGKVAEGLFWLAEAVEVGELVEASEDLRRVARINLTLWGQELRPLRGAFVHHAGYLSRMLTKTSQVRPQFNPKPWETGHKALAFHPRKPLLFTCQDRIGQLIDLARGEKVGPPMPHDGTIYSAAFSPDGNTLLTACLDGKVRRWRGDTGILVDIPQERMGAVIDVAFAPDGKTGFTVSGNGIHLWEAAAGRKTFTFYNSSAVLSAAFSPDSRYILAGCRSGVAHLWDVSSRKHVRTVKHLGQKFKGEVHLACFSSDGKVMATGFDGVCLWSVPSGDSIGSLIEHDGATWTMAFTPDGKELITTGAFDGIKVWDASSGTALPKQEFSPMIEGMTTSLGFNPTGEFLVIAGMSDVTRVWHVNTRTPDGPGLQHEAGVAHAAFSPDGRFLITWTSRGMLRVWQATRPRPAPLYLTEKGQETIQAVSADGTTAAVASGRLVTLRDIRTGKVRGQSLEHNANVEVAWFSPNGKVVVTGDSAQIIRRWDAASGKLFDESRPVGQAIEQVEGDAAGETIWVNRRLLWRSGTSETANTTSPAPLFSSVGFRADGQVFVAQTGRTQVQVISAWSGETMGSPLRADALINVTAFSGDGQTLALGDAIGVAQVYRWEQSGWKASCPPLSTADGVFQLLLSG